MSGTNDSQVITKAERPEWLVNALSASKRSAKLPEWIKPPFPSVVLDGYKLDDDEITSLYGALKQSSPEKVHPLILELRNHRSPGAFDEFCWHLFELWESAKFPPKEKWAMFAVGLLASNDVVCKLIPLMRQWRLKSFAERAKFGMDCLLACGSDAAMTEIDYFSHDVDSKSLYVRGNEILEDMAREKGVSKAQLEDRFIPTCGVDENGFVKLGANSKKIRVILKEDLIPIVQNNLEDDQGVTSGSDTGGNSAEWDSFQKKAQAIAKFQSMRLELAMIYERKWSVEDISVLVNHPLMYHLVKRLLWGAYTGDGNLSETFRVSDDKTFTDSKDKAVDLKQFDHMKVVHPYFLSPHQKEIWGEYFTDYEISELFPQWNRQVHVLDESELEEREIKKLKDLHKIEVNSRAIIKNLENSGWIKGEGSSSLAGPFAPDFRIRQFPPIDLTAIVQYEDARSWDRKTPNWFQEIFFVKGLFTMDLHLAKSRSLQLKHISPIIVSEVLRDLVASTAGKE